MWKLPTCACSRQVELPHSPSCSAPLQHAMAAKGHGQDPAIEIMPLSIYVPLFPNPLLYHPPINQLQSVHKPGTNHAHARTHTHTSTLGVSALLRNIVPVSSGSLQQAHALDSSVGRAMDCNCHTCNPQVAGSNPARESSHNKLSRIQDAMFLFFFSRFCYYIFCPFRRPSLILLMLRR